MATSNAEVLLRYPHDLCSRSDALLHGLPRGTRLQIVNPSAMIYEYQVAGNLNKKMNQGSPSHVRPFLNNLTSRLRKQTSVGEMEQVRQSDFVPRKVFLLRQDFLVDIQLFPELCDLGLENRFIGFGTRESELWTTGW
jgi:hypothetical protein